MLWAGPALSVTCQRPPNAALTFALRENLLLGVELTVAPTRVVRFCNASVPQTHSSREAPVIQE